MGKGLEQVDEARALELVDAAPDGAGEAGRDVLEAHPRIGLPQPVGVAALEFPEQQADRFLTLLERDVEALALHEGLARDPDHRQHRGGVDRADGGDQQRIRAHQHARDAHAHDQHVRDGRDRDRREEEGGAGHHRGGDDADPELLARTGVVEEIAGRDTPDDADQHGLVGDAIKGLARYREDLAPAEPDAMTRDIMGHHDQAEQPQDDVGGGGPAPHHVADQDSVEDLAEGGDLHRLAHFDQLRGAHPAPAPASRGSGEIADDSPVEFGQALVGHEVSDLSPRAKALGKR
jgi:hypothetical protein